MDENLPNKVDQIFNQTLKKFESDPSPAVWRKIEEKLEEEDRRTTGFVFGWKRYAAAIVLLLAISAVLTKIYFHSQTIFTQEMAKQQRPEIPVAIVSKDVPAESRDLSKTDQRSAGRQNNKTFFNDSKPDKREKKSGILVPESGTNKTMIFHNHGNMVVRQDDPDGIIGHIVSVQAPSLPLSSIQIKPPALQLPKIENRSLSLVHPRKRGADRFSITTYFSKEFAGYNFKDEDLTGPHGQEIEQRERNVFSASVGFFLNYDINKKWVLQSGLSYSWSNSNIDSCTSYAVKDNQGSIQYKLNTISGYGYLEPASATQPNVGDSVSTAKSYSQLHYLTIPLVLSYRISMKKFTLLAGAGGSFNILTGAEIETNTYGNGSPEKEYCVNMMGLKKINFGMIVKLDLEYSVSSHIGVNIIPSFKNTLSPINLESAVAAYPYNFGIGVGMTYRF